MLPPFLFGLGLKPHPTPSPKERDKKIMEKIILLVGQNNTKAQDIALR